MPDYFHLAKRQIASRILAEQRKVEENFSPLRRALRKLLPVKVSDYYVARHFYERGEQHVFKRYAALLKNKPENVPIAALLSNPGAQHFGIPEMLAASHFLDDLMKLHRRPSITPVKRSVIADEVAPWVHGYRKLLASLEKERLISKRGEHIMVSPRQVKLLKEFVRA